MDINGIPAHALITHAAVVFGPLSALGAIAYALVPRWRDWLRWPLVVTAAIALVTIWASYFTGESWRDDDFEGATGEFAERLDKHEDLAGILRISVTVFAVVTFAAAWFHTRTGTTRYVLSGLLVASAVVTLVYVVLTGDAGAKTVHGSYAVG